MPTLQLFRREHLWRPGVVITDPEPDQVAILFTHKGVIRVRESTVVGVLGMI